MQVEKRESMVFYDSFFESIVDLPAEEFKKSMCAILNYGLRGETPETTGIEKTIFVLVKPQIDKNNQRWNNAKKSRNGYEKKKAKTVAVDENESIPEQEPYPVLNEPETVEEADNFDEDFDIELEEEIFDSTSFEKGKEQNSLLSSKIACGEFKNVYLTAVEKATLINDLGVTEYQRRLDFFSSYLKRKPDHRSACHFIDMRDWVANAVKERQPKEQQKTSPLSGYDFEDFYEKP